VSDQITEQTQQAQFPPPSPGPINVPSSKKPKVLSLIIVSFLANVIVTGAALWYYDNHFAMKLKTVDVRAFTTDLEKQLINRKIENKDVTQRFVDLKLKIQKESSPNTVVLLKEIIINGQVPEITPDHQ
jgi:hypothetical protein